MPNTCFGKRRKRGEPKAGDFGGQHDNEYTLRGMMWADNYWLFSDNREKLICMVNDIIEELLDLDMERNPESLWWTSTFQDENMRTLRVGSETEPWIFPCAKSLMYWDTVSTVTGRCFKVSNAVCARP